MMPHFKNLSKYIEILMEIFNSVALVYLLLLMVSVLLQAVVLTMAIIFTHLLLSIHIP